MKIFPLRDKIVVKLQTKQEKTDSGIFLPSNSTSKLGPVLAEVKAVGPGMLAEDGKTLIPVSVKVGDVVLVSEHVRGTKVEHNDEECQLVSESDVFAVLA